MNQASDRHHLYHPPRGHVLVSELKVTMHCTEATVYARAEKLGITPQLWGQERTVTDEEAQQLMETTRHDWTPEEAQDAGLLKAQEAAARLGITHRMFMLRIQEYGIQPVHLKGVLGNQVRYHPRDVARIPVNPAPCGCPRGYVTGETLAAMCGLLKEGTVRGWVKRGCPATRDRLGNHRYYFQPHAVLAWLKANPPHPRANTYSKNRRARLIERLNYAIQQKEAA